MISHTALVTGATGFVGRHVCEHLLSSGIRVRGLVRSPHPKVPSGVDAFAANDLTDASAVRRALDGVDTVVHLAARVHVGRETAADPLAEHRRVNVEGTRTLLKEAIARRVQRFVFISTIATMGRNGDRPLSEEMQPTPSNAYGVSKLEAEGVVRRLALDAGIHAPILRLPLVYGPWMRGTMNMLRLFELVDRGLPLPFGRVRNKRSFAYVGNVVQAIQAVLDSPAAAHETFLVSDGEDISTPDLILLIGRMIGKPARLVPVPVSLMRAAGRVGDLVGTVVSFPLNTAAVDRLLGSLVIDPSKLRRVAGFVPPFTVEQGMRLTAQWYSNRRA